MSTTITGWRKSSYSNSGTGQCVEIGTAPGLVGIQDTKNRGPHLKVSRSAFAAFVKQVTK